jgi:hypothetical protein
VVSLLARPEEIEARSVEVSRSADLSALAANLEASVARLLDGAVYVPSTKAQLSRWGSMCRDDLAPLGFDPWSPHEQRCERCGRIWSTEQSHRWWVYWYQLWLAERVLILALLSRMAARPRAGERAVEILAALVERYPTYPNADNVLGPSRPFFSTYLESIWVLQLAAATSLLEEAGEMPPELASDLRDVVFRPSAGIISDFDEGRSNRQAWNAAALYALGRVLGDRAMASAAARGPSGILGVLERGLHADGLWYEGENYHWFALRGLTWGVEMLRASGETDLWTGEGELPGRWHSAFRAPLLTVLPDFTQPARRDSRFGVSLRQRRSAELWELAYARARFDWASSVLSHVYHAAEPTGAGSLEREVTEVERQEPPSGVRRSCLGWKGLLWMARELPETDPDAWRPGTVLLGATGLAVFRRDSGSTYVSLDYGESGGGHGHPDRLNLTVVSQRVPWLLDFGTGSYVSPDLAWYRSTLAHNAPLLDGVSQAPARGSLLAFDERGDFGWACAQLPDGTAYDGVALQRTVVVTPWYLLDVMQMASAAGERQLALPWHGLGSVAATEEGITFQRPGGDRLRILLVGRQPFQIQLSSAPGPPADEPQELTFPIAVARGETVTLVACLDLSGTVGEIECAEDDFLVRLADGEVHTHSPTDDGWRIDLGRGDPVILGGVREDAEIPEPAPRAQAVERSTRPAAECLRVAAAPLLDGTPAGFRTEAPLLLDRDDQFRRAEEAWEGPDEFSARAYLNTDGESLFLAVEVTAPQPVFRPAGEPDPELENENPDIHGDGLQVYVDVLALYGWVVVPDTVRSDRLRVSAVRGTDAEPEMVAAGSWRMLPNGYSVTLAIALPDLPDEFGFDLLVNRGKGGRERRVGQLVWSGAKSTRLYLAGDRPATDVLPRVRVR